MRHEIKNQIKRGKAENVFCNVWVIKKIKYTFKGLVKCYRILNWKLLFNKNVMSFLIFSY